MNAARVHFSVADRPMENFLSAGAFDRSLLLNTLFEPGILIPDVFCAISGGLEQHLANPHVTLFEACIEDGIVAPSLRGRTFLDAFRVIKAQDIQGVRPSAEKTMQRLQMEQTDAKSFYLIVHSQI